MKIGSFQGVSVAYYIRNGKNELKAIKAVQDLNRFEAKKAVKITISQEALDLAGKARKNES